VRERKFLLLKYHLLLSSATRRPIDHATARPILDIIPPSLFSTSRLRKEETRERKGMSDRGGDQYGDVGNDPMHSSFLNCDSDADANVSPIALVE